MVRTVGLRGYSDVHFTDSALARRIVEHFAPQGDAWSPSKERAHSWSTCPRAQNSAKSPKGGTSLNTARTPTGL